MTVPATAPEELRRAARALGESGGQVRRLSARAARLECGTAQHWQGLAGIGHRARVHSLRLALSRYADPLEELAAAVAGLAAQAETAQQSVRSLTARREAALLERSTLASTPVDPTDPVELVRRQQRIEELDLLTTRLTAEIDEQESLMDRVASAVQERMDSLWPDDLARDLRALVEVAGAVGGAWAGLGRVGRGGLLLWTVERARWVDLAVRTQLAERGDRLVRALRKAPWWSKVARVPGPWAVPLTIAPTAIRDIGTGGGYDGPRGVITRVGGAVAIPSSILLVAPVPSPHLKAVGAIGLGSYGLWKAGNAVYEHREVIPVLADAAWEAAKERADALLDGLDPRQVVLGPLSPLGPLLGSEQAQEWLRGRLDDLVDGVDETAGRWRDLLHGLGDTLEIPIVDLPELPDGVPWDEIVRDLGRPIGIPGVRIDDWLRLPAIPPFGG